MGWSCQVQGTPTRRGSRKGGRKEQSIVSVKLYSSTKDNALPAIGDNDCVGLLFGFAFHTEPEDAGQAQQNNLKLSLTHSFSVCLAKTLPTCFPILPGFSKRRKKCLFAKRPSLRANRRWIQTGSIEELHRPEVKGSHSSWGWTENKWPRECRALGGHVAWDGLSGLRQSQISKLVRGQQLWLSALKSRNR